MKLKNIQLKAEKYDKIGEENGFIFYHAEYFVVEVCACGSDGEFVDSITGKSLGTNAEVRDYYFNEKGEPIDNPIRHEVIWKKS